MSQSIALRRGSITKRKQNIAAYLFITPFVVLFVAMLLIPLGYSGYLSLFKSQMVGGTVFAGLANYLMALTDPLFISSVLRVVLFLVIQVPIMLGLALLFALAIDSGRVRGSRFVRLVIFIPYAVPGVVGALMWGYLYGRDFGPISQAIKALGLPTPDLLSSDLILGSIMNISIWGFAGYNMIVLYSALRAIPAELYDAAQVDGAGQFRIAWSVKIPAIKPALLLTLIFSIIGGFQLFTEPSLLYSIAPNAVGQSFSPNLYAYNQAFVSENTNYAAAIAFLLGFVIMIVSYVVQLPLLRKEKVQ
jgi:multiple sugar transport system permease protein